jgi:hypothetical protein
MALICGHIYVLFQAEQVFKPFSGHDPETGGRLYSAVEQSVVWLVRPGESGPPNENLFFGLVAFLVDLRIDVTRIRPSAFRNIAGYIDKFTGLFAGRTDVGGGLHINGVTTFVAFEDSHSIPPS